MSRRGRALALLLTGLALLAAPLGWDGLAAQAPEAPEATVELERQGETIGDPITIWIRLEFETGGRLALPDSPLPLGPLDPAVPELVATLNLESGRTSALVALRTRAFFTGPLEVELPALTVIDADGTPRSVALAPLRLEVASVLPEDLSGVELRPLKPAERIGGAPPSPALVLGPILGAASLLLLGLLLRRRRARRALVVAEPPPDPAAVALAELAAIREAGLLPGQVEEFCRRVDGAVRRFLASRYALPASNLTARELTARLAGAGMEAGTLTRVRSLCAETDAVAYAGARPAADRVARYVELAGAIVQPPQFATGGAADGGAAGAEAGPERWSRPGSEREEG